ncbi:MAG: hypothetical protein HQL13_05145 [Candidatus Omnitrophica bacterium]|nr:hypothetical protein [Candidatus Omnitrophota bacterium]
MRHLINKIIVLVAAFLGTLTINASAQLFLEKGKESVTVSGGEHLNGSLILHNTATKEANIKVYWEDFTYKAPYDGTKEFLAAGTTPTTAASWVTFAPQTFSMPAKGQQTIDYTIAVPASIKEGHYGVLFFEQAPEAMSSEKGVSLIVRVGCLFFIEPNNKVKKALLQDVVLKQDRLSVNFVNQANVVLIPHTTYYIMEQGGVVVHRGDVKRLYVPPGATGSVVIPLTKKLTAGHYTMVINGDMEDGDIVVKEIGLAVDAAGQITIESTQD